MDVRKERMQAEGERGGAAKKTAQTAEQVWRQYQRGKDYLHKYDYYHSIEEAYRYYKGDQWNGLKLSGEKPPALNILAPIVDYKVATVANNGMSINYSTMNYGRDYEDSMQVCALLNSHGAKTWERLKMDRAVWRHVSAAAISGDSCAYFYQGDKGLIETQMLDMSAVYFADEQEADIQRQKYLILAQRLFVSDVRAQARKNGLDESEVALIMPDGDVQTQIGQRAKEEIKQEEEDGKCVCLLKMWKEDGEVHFLRATKNVVYQEDTHVAGMKLYPVAHLCWDEEKGSARGIGEVVRRIPNQIEINKTLARNIAAIKQTAYPHIVYDRDKLSAEAVGRLGVVGSTIAVGKGAGGIVEDIRKHLNYLEPAQVNPAAISMVSELMQSTRELAGAGEAVTGNINPERASGAAIIAVRDASALPLNDQTAGFKQFVEDVALIWFDMWVAYNPMGMEIVIDKKDEQTGEIIPTLYTIPREQLETLKIDVRIDVSPSNPFSKFAREQAIEKLLERGLIDFEIYVELLDDDATAPKEKLIEAVEKLKQRKEAELVAREQMVQMPRPEEAAMLESQQQGGNIPPGPMPQDSEQFIKTDELIEKLMRENAALKAEMNKNNQSERMKNEKKNV